MYGLIRSALRKPITVIVAIAGLLFFAILSLLKIPADIFPSLNLPTIYVVQPYGGMSPEEMDGFIATRYQDHFLYVTGIKDVEIKSIQGLSLMKLQFYPNTDMAQAAGEVANNISRAKAYMPEGTVPPQVVRFDASSVPIGQLVFESPNRSLNEIQDFAASRIRPMFSKIEGVSSPPPFGGNQRSIVIKIDPNLMRSYQLSADEIIKMIAQSNQPSPAGNIRLKDKTYMSPVNSLIKKPEDFLTIPIKTGSGPTVTVGDIGTVEDGADVTVSYALINGKRAVYIPVVKKADASTLDVVDNIKKELPKLRDAVPEDVKINFEFDQSVYVINALKSLVTEGILGAILTGLMVLLFLKDWRSVIIVVLTIPISILSSIVLLHIFGQTINIMTLSGLALAIGILVDEATVTIENVHQHLEMSKPKTVAIWEACKEIAFPKLLILLAILAVFAPALIMEGVPRSMFLPLSLAVGFAMISSFLLSQTFVPVLSNWLLKNHSHTSAGIDQKKGFERFKRRYAVQLKKLLNKPKPIVLTYLSVSVLLIVGAFLFIGTDILPKSNNKQFQLRLKAEDGTRIERTEAATLKVLDIIKEKAGKENVKITSAFVGNVPSSYGTSNIFIFNSGPHEALMQVALSHDLHVNMDEFKEELRKTCAQELPGINISFEPIELVEKIMSQGSNTPIEVTVAGKDIKEAGKYAKKIADKLKDVSFLRDLQLAQPMNYPILKIDVNRQRAAQLGLSSTQVAKSLVAATSSSRFVEKNLWLDNAKGLAYQVQVQIPEYKMSSLAEVNDIPLKSGPNAPVLADVATLSEDTAPGEYDRSGSNRLVTITANIHKKDLGSARNAVLKALSEIEKPPRGILVEMKGQPKLLDETLKSLQLGLLIAIVIIFLMLSANFQSFKISVIILSAIPAVLTGSLWFLLAAGSTLNLQSYMGLIMSVGVSIANALLLISSAEKIRLETKDSYLGAITAAKTRIRPILMTSLAMIAGMLPMASGLGEAGDQVAPLGQAVIGGLIASTFSTLFILPLVFHLVQRKTGTDSLSLDPEDPESNYYKTNDLSSLTNTNMPPKKKIPVYQASAILLPLLFLFSCQTQEKTETASSSKSDKIEMTEVRKLQPQKNISLPGELKAWEKVDLYPKVKGFVKTLFADRGTIVKKGQVLAILESPESLAEQERSFSQYNGSLAQLEEAKVKFAASRSQYQRLLQTSKTVGAVSASQIEQTYSKLLADSSLVAIAQQDVYSASENYKAKKQLVDYLTIKAPIDGYIMERNVSEGALVGPELNGQKPLFLLVNNSTLRLTVAVPEIYSNSIPLETEINFSVNSLPDRKFKAHYSRSAENIDNNIRVMIVEFDVTNEDRLLKAGMYADVTIPTKRSYSTLFLPSKSIITSSEKVFVIKVNKGIAQWQEVKKGYTVDSLTEVFGELNAGDLVVRKASEELRDGQSIN